MSDYQSTASDEELPLFAPVARNSDPATSHMAAAKIESKRGTMASRMLQAFATPSTRNEAAAFCVMQFGGLHESYRKRTGEIKDQLELLGTKVCKVTGSLVEYYQAKKP